MLKESEPKYLLDTSALLTLIEDEAGADEVEKILREKKVILPFIVLLEVYYISLTEEGEEIADRRYAMLKSLDAEFITSLDEPTLLTAGRLKARYRISLADAIISACAITHDAILVHKDQEYEALQHEVKQYILPYKR